MAFFHPLFFQQARVENFILWNAAMDVSLHRVKEVTIVPKFFDMKCLSWMFTLKGCAKRESRENRELSRNCVQ